VAINGKHECLNEWTINNYPIRLSLKDFNIPNLEIIKFEDIATKRVQGNNLRYECADYRFPMVVAKNVQNPYNKKYRLIDGKNRLHKLKRMGIQSGLFFVISEDEFMKVFNKTKCRIEGINYGDN
tara:strand:- start:2375 stop:2749 length:375 start_codon:yes stop_codon:yes gene_type:complete